VLGYALDCTKAGSKERHPVARDKQVGLHVANVATDFDPVEWVARMDLLANVQVGWSFLGGVLRLAWEKERRILQGESDDLHRVSFRLELAREALVEGGEPTAEGICCAE